jgi:hypothetical protein
MSKAFFVFIFLLMGSLSSKAQQQGLVYVYNAGEDSLHFPELSTIGLFRVHNYLLVDSLDVNGDGHPEMVFHRYFSGSEEAHGGTFDISTKQEISAFEIWDLQKKTCLFSGIMSMVLSDNRFDIHSTYAHNGYCRYFNKISILNDGRVLVEALERLQSFESRITGGPISLPECQCTLPKGTYLWRDGAFVLVGD